jgi:hypothetical protein
MWKIEAQIDNGIKSAFYFNMVMLLREQVRSGLLPPSYRDDWRRILAERPSPATDGKTDFWMLLMDVSGMQFV